MSDKLKNDPNISMVMCHGQGSTPDHPACQGVQAFPTFKDKDNKVCHMGAGPVADIKKKCGF